MPPETTNGGTSKETLKMVIKFASSAIVVLLGVVGFLLSPYISAVGDRTDRKESKGEYTQPNEFTQPNTELLRMLKEQMQINNRMAIAAEKSVEVQEDTKSILQSILNSQLTSTSNLELALKRQVTKQDYEKLATDVKEQISKNKK